MTLKAEVIDGVNGILEPEWEVREGRLVPTTDDINLTNGAVCLDATYLYADMADSTGLAQGHYDWAVAKVIRCYLNVATRLIRNSGGKIRSFDGDRVQGIFVGDSKDEQAVRAGMQITWSIHNIIRPALIAKWPTFRWTMNHGVGIDTGRAMLVRGGAYRDNDLISIGAAPNVAAKLSELRDRSEQVFVTPPVYRNLPVSLRMLRDVNIWSNLGVMTLGGKEVTCYGTAYLSEP